MSKKTCFVIFAIAIVAILASYAAHFSLVTKEVSAVFAQMQNVYIALSSVILSLIMTKTKHYWLIMLGVSVVVAGAVQILFGGSLLTIALLYKILAFIVYVYLVALLRFML